MTSFIDRFVDTDDPSLLLSFRDLFGDEKCRELWKGLKGIDKEDAIVDTYCRQLQKRGKYSFVGSSVILDPNADQSHYHLVYATYHPEGMRVFREVEVKAHTEQESFRSEVAKQKRADKGIRDLFEHEVLASKYDQQLLRRYQDKARRAVEDHVRKNRRVSYDDLERTALTLPLTHGQLNKWIREWQTAKLVKLEGLGPRERVPKPDQHHYVVWTGPI
jgi:hypothetical protein